MTEKNADTAQRMISFVLNGHGRNVPAGWSLDDLVDDLKLHRQVIAIEVNQQIVRRDAWRGHPIRSDDRVEIVHFVGGG